MKPSSQRYKYGLLNLSLLVLFVFFGINKSQAFSLSEQAEVSLITCAPGNGASTVYGHTAIRVKDLKNNYDLAFNYGIYDFDAPNFLYRFASGETDYLLAAYKFDSFINSYKRYNRSVFEQVLDLTLAEKQKIVDFLIWNAQPENRVYRYNFFFDNCATRVRDVIAENVDGGITFNEAKHSHKTLRQLVEGYHGKLLWLTFGIDLAVSYDSDREATYWEEMLLPDYLMSYFADATKAKNNIPLVKHTSTVYKAPVASFKSYKLFSPFIVLLLCALLIAVFSYKQFRSGKMKNGLDFLVFGITGIMGIILAWLALCSEHPAMSPNYNLLWALPLNLLFAFLLLVKRWRLLLKYYHLFISAWLLLFSCCSPFIGQKFHPAFYCIVLMLLSRSVFHSLLVFKELKERKQG